MCPLFKETVILIGTLLVFHVGFREGGSCGVPELGSRAYRKLENLRSPGHWNLLMACEESWIKFCGSLVSMLIPLTPL